MLKCGEGGRGVGDVDGLEGGIEGYWGEGQEAVSRDAPAPSEDESLEGVAARKGGQEATVGETWAIRDIDAGQGRREGGNGSRQIRVIDERGRKGEG